MHCDIGVMDGMAIKATHIRGHVRRTREIIVLALILMALEAPLSCFLGIREDVLEGTDLLRITARFRVGASRPVAAFTALEGWTTSSIRYQLEMFRALETLEKELMALLAAFRAYKFAVVGCGLLILYGGFCLSASVLRGR